MHCRGPLAVVVLAFCNPAAAQENIWANVPADFRMAERGTETALSPSQEQSVVKLLRSLPPPWTCDEDREGEWLTHLQFSNMPLSTTQVILVEAGRGCARGGQGANGAMWLIRFDRHRPVLLAGPEQGFGGYLYSVLKTGSKGYRDLVLGWHMSAFEAGLVYFRFDGKVYRPLGGANAMSDGDGRSRITPIKPAR